MSSCEILELVSLTKLHKLSDTLIFCHVNTVAFFLKSKDGRNVNLHPMWNLRVLGPLLSLSIHLRRVIVILYYPSLLSLYSFRLLYLIFLIFVSCFFCVPFFFIVSSNFDTEWAVFKRISFHVTSTLLCLNFSHAAFHTRTCIRAVTSVSVWRRWSLPPENGDGVPWF